MGIQMKGIDVANHITEELAMRVERLKEAGVVPCLAIVRVGERADDLAYERGAKKRMEKIGARCCVTAFPEDVSKERFEAEFSKINEDSSVHGILLFRPLPAQLDEEAVKAVISPEKDVDGMSGVNAAKVFSGDESGYAPCTPEAVMEMLDFYGIDPAGKKVTVIGRSMVVGKPLAMMLLKKNATVTICHTKTENMAKICREADILVAAAGKAKMVTADMAGENAVVVDVGINADEDGGLCGDVDYHAVEAKASYISPVPKGVGSVTSSVLAKHVVKAAEMNM